MAWPRKNPIVALLAGVLIAGFVSVFASDPPDSEINPANGYIEIADSAWEGSRYNIRHITDPGDGSPLEVITLSGHPADDLSPRIEISSAGDTWVVWCRDQSTGRVLVRKKTYSTGSWSSERTVSSSNESSRNPEVVHDGTDVWVAYEYDSALGTSVGVSIIEDEPDPIDARTEVGTTTYGGDLDVLIRFGSGNLWVTWIDSDTHVGWSEYDYGAAGWSAAEFESYANDDVDAARSRIRTTVLGN